MNKLKYVERVIPEALMSYVGNDAEEIRIRINKTALVVYPGREVITDVVFNREKIDEFIDRITKSSIYTFSEDIAKGFITISGGHRVGLSGTAVYENGNIKNLKDISYINIRIARELIGVGEGVFAKIFHSGLVNTLIISPPGGGKTTLLRDLTRIISSNIPRVRVAVIDERNEIAASFLGEPQNDIGIRSDVLTGYLKPDGIIRAIRSMSPDVIILDEIGGNDDENAILKCKYSGVNVIATMHGDSIEDFKTNFKKLYEEKTFSEFIIINKNFRTSEVISKGEIYA